MRDLGFQVEFLKTEKRLVQIILHTAAGYTAQELIDDEIIGDSFRNFGEVLALAKGVENQTSISVEAKNRIVISLSADVVSSAWEVASLLNLVDGASFIMQDEDDPALAKVEVNSPYDLSLEDVYTDLERYLEGCRQTMTGFLPADFVVDEYLGREWPAVSGDYMYRVLAKTSSPMPAEVQELASRLLTNMDQLSAESAFEPEVSPMEWLENGNIPYPVEITVNETSVSYVVEMPPSDFGLNILLLKKILQKNFDIDFSAWSFEIREGW